MRVERRQALNELAERLHRRERELREELDREQTKRSRASSPPSPMSSGASSSGSSGWSTARRRSTWTQAGVQFMDAIKRSREESARRLSRELERAVETFTHEAESLIAERIENSARRRPAARPSSRRRRLDHRPRRDEVVAAVEQRLAAAERELRQRLDELSADADAQRAILDARLFELQRRIDTTLSQVKALDA